MVFLGVKPSSGFQMALQGRGVVKSEVPGGGWILEDEGGKRQIYQPEE